MTSLFLPFDYYYFLLPSIFTVVMIFLIFNNYYFFSSNLILISSVSSYLIGFFFNLKPKKFNKFSGLIILTLFFLLMMINLFSVFPFNFPLTSQVSFIFFWSVSFWSCLIFFSFINNLKGFLSHMIPEGSPLILTIFLFLIELISSTIRPLTLMVRLVANILAGHLLMILLSSLVFIFKPCLIIYFGLNLVELFVALIQSYIFTTMMVLYYSEI